MIPKRRTILGKVWKIKEIERPVCDDGAECWGLCDTDKREIFIKSTLTEDQKIRTFLHEVFHAVIHESKVKLTHEKEEDFVSALEQEIIKLFEVFPK